MRVQAEIVQVERRAAERRLSGRPYAGVRRLLVVRDDRLGDLVLTLPAIAALRAAYPQAHLMLLVRPSLVPLARMVRGVDEVLEAPARAGALLEAVRAAAPDLAVDVARGRRAAWALARAGVPRRVGAGRRFWSPLFHRRVGEPRRAGGRHEVEYALSFAHRAGAQARPARFELSLPRAAVEQAGAWLASQGRDGRFAVLHPGSGGSCPAWPPRRWIELHDALVAAGVRVVFSVGPADAAVERALAASPTACHTPRFGGDPVALAALLARAAVVAGNSTGPVHLAAALGARALAVHAPWTSCGPGRWGPYSDRGWAVVAQPASKRGSGPEWTPRRRAREAAALLAGLDVVPVTAAVMALLAGRRPAAP